MTWGDGTLGYVHIDVRGAERIDFDRAPVRRSMRAAGREVRAEARRLVARDAISKAGEYPGRKTGTLARSIKESVSRSGFLVVVKPRMRKGDDYYPAYLWYGVRNGAVRQKSHKKQIDRGLGWRIAPRGNYMADALLAHADAIRASLEAALPLSLKVS